MLNILDPNRGVKPNSFMLRQPDGKTHTVLRLRIKRLGSSGVSFMPEGLEQQVGICEMAYLESLP